MPPTAIKIDGTDPVTGDAATLRVKYKATVANARAIVSKADAEKRSMTSEETEQFDTLMTEADGMRHRFDNTSRGRQTDPGPIGRGSRDAGGPGPVIDGEIRSLGRGERMADFVRTLREPGEPEPESRSGRQASIGRFLRGVIVGKWDGAGAEERMQTDLSVSGGYLVPSMLSANVIDLARSASVCFAAGAQLLPMLAGQVDVARLATDPTGEWRPELTAVNDSELEFQRVTLSAKTVAAVVPVSIELMEDAPNAADVLEKALVAALGLKLDAAALRGTGATMPTGIRYDTDVQSITSVGALSYDDLATAVQMLRTENCVTPPEKLAMVYAPRTGGELDRIKDGNGLWADASPAVKPIPRFQTTSIPVTLGGGTETELFVGDFSQLVIGVRTRMTVEVNRFGGDDSAFRKLKVLVRAYLRADTMLMQPTHFCYLSGITPP